MRYKVTVEPTVNCVSLSECKSDLRIKGSYADTKLLSLIAAAQTHVEDVCGLHTITRTVEINSDHFPSRREILPVTPVQCVVSIKYLDSDGNLQLVDPSVYHLEDDEYQPKLYKKSDPSWPSDLSSEYERIFITVKSGYGDSASSVKANIRRTIKFLVNHWYENNTPVVVGAVPIAVPMSFNTLIKSFKRYR
jgi:uncharacterized phiE125 gp8 family phage protein